MREGQWPPPRDVETPLVSGAKVVVDGKDVTGVRVPIHMVRGTVNADLTFEFRTWPGPHWLRVSTESPEWKVKSIRYKGSDITNEGSIDFVEGQDVIGI